LHHVSKQQNVLALHVEAAELVDSNDVPLLSESSHFEVDRLTHECGDEGHAVTEFDFDAEVGLLLRPSPSSLVVFFALLEGVSDLQHLED